MNARKVLHLLPHNVDAALVGRVQLEDTRAHQFRSVQLLCEREDGGRLAGAGRAVEEHVRQVGGLEGAAQDVGGVFLRGDIVERLGAAVLVEERVDG